MAAINDKSVGEAQTGQFNCAQGTMFQLLSAEGVYGKSVRVEGGVGKTNYVNKWVGL